MIGNDGALYRKTASRLQLVLTKRYHSLVLRHLHDGMGHLGMESLVVLIQGRSYWPHVAREIERNVTSLHVLTKETTFIAATCTSSKRHYQAF